MPKTKPKKVNYSPAKTIKTLEKSLTVRQALVPEVLREEDLKRKAINMAVKGRSHDHIARRLGITLDQAVSYIKEKLQSYVREAYDPAEVKELLSKRYDNIYYQALYLSMPHPRKDEFGRPMVGNTCKCELEEGQLCSEEGHTAVLMCPPDPTWAKIALEVLGEEKKMFGVDAADKMKQQLVDTLHREYRGVSAETIEKL